MKKFDVTVEETRIVVYTVYSDSQQEAGELVMSRQENFVENVIDSNIENIINVESAN